MPTPPKDPASLVVETPDDIRRHVEGVGQRLVTALDAVLDGLPRRPSGPQYLSRAVGTTLSTSSRLMKGLAQADPVAAVQQLPGPKPLRQFVDLASEQGVTEAIAEEAIAAIEALDDAMTNLAGGRGPFRALLTAWLPQANEEFEAERRQAIFKARSELEGVSVDLLLASFVIFPGSEPTCHSIAVTMGMIGLDRIRPEARVRMGLVRHGIPREDEDREVRRPTDLDGEPIEAGLEGLRLLPFYGNPPAELVARQLENFTQYELAPGIVGPRSRMDHLTCEVNRDELRVRPFDPDRPPSVWYVPETPSRSFVLDLLLHESIYPDLEPEALVYNTTGMGPTWANNPERAIDLRPNPPQVEALGRGVDRMRIPEFPRQPEVQAHVLERLGLDPVEMRAYRLTVRYPLGSDQFTLALVRP